MELVTLGGKNSLEQVVAVARYGAKVEFSAEYRARVNACRAHVERFSREGKDRSPLYGTPAFHWKRPYSSSCSAI